MCALDFSFEYVGFVVWLHTLKKCTVFLQLFAGYEQFPNFTIAKMIKAFVTFILYISYADSVLLRGMTKGQSFVTVGQILRSVRSSHLAQETTNLLNYGNKQARASFSKDADTHKEHALSPLQVAAANKAKQQKVSIAAMLETNKRYERLVNSLFSKESDPAEGEFWIKDENAEQKAKKPSVESRNNFWFHDTLVKPRENQD